MAGVPPKLKAIAHYIKIANEYANRDPATYYWCLLYGVQKGMQIDKTSPECKQFLMQHLSLLEQIKKNHADNEAITNEVVASAHVEGVALKLFTYADTEDRASRFNKNVVKAFYTAGYLFDVLAVFGEVDTQIIQQQKYAKWKAAYIHNCLKTGETPVPGPAGGEEGLGDEFGEAGLDAGGKFANNTFIIPPAAPNNDTPARGSTPPPTLTSYVNPASTPVAVAVASSYSGGTKGGLSPAEYMKAQKFCKYAISALEYEDAPTAIENLRQALELLQTTKK